MKKSIIILIVLLIILAVLNNMFGLTRVIPEMLFGETESEVQLEPMEFPEGITDIRITAVPAEYHTGYETFDERQLYRIYYGYQVDAQWYDMPSENYNLKGIFQDHGELGWQAAGKSHLVEIGPFLLICVQDDCMDSADRLTISDSLGTPVQMPLEPYYSKSEPADGEPKNGYLKFEPTPADGSEGNFNVSSHFGRYYFLLVRMEDITDDYQVVKRKPDVSTTREYTLTAKEIRYLLDDYG